MLEFDILILPLDPSIQQALEAKTKEGWMLVPGTQPRALYQICRPVQANSLSEHKGFGQLGIDDSKVHVVDKDGKIVQRH
jgi:hypothetical protein